MANRLSDIQNFAKNVKHVCYWNGVKLGDFEKEVGLSKGYFSRILSGSKNDCSFTIAIAVAKKCGYPIDHLVSNDLSYLEREKDIANAENEIKNLENKIKELKGEE